MTWLEKNMPDIRKGVRHAMFCALDGKATKAYIGDKVYWIAPVYDRTKDVDSRHLFGVGVTDETGDPSTLCATASIKFTITEMIDILIEGIRKDFVAKDGLHESKNTDDKSSEKGDECRNQTSTC